MVQPSTPPSGTAPFCRGISTVTLRATNLAAAKDWYSRVLGLEPSFDTPEYVEFALGPERHEFGILDARYAGANWAGVADETPGGAVVHLWVDDADAALAALIAAGAEPYQPARTFSGGYRGGSVVDPFGNVVGAIQRG